MAKDDTLVLDYSSEPPKTGGVGGNPNDFISQGESSENALIGQLNHIAEVLSGADNKLSELWSENDIFRDSSKMEIAEEYLSIVSDNEVIIERIMELIRMLDGSE